MHGPHHSSDAEIRSLESAARRHETPCGAGHMAWRNWGKGSPLLLLHGGSGSWMHWLKNIPALMQRFSIWAPDMPGFGESDLPPEPYEMHGYVAILRAGLEKLVPDARIDVAGFSLGAGLSTRLACLLEGRFGNLVLSGANFFKQGPGGVRRNLVSLRRARDEHELMQAVRHNIRIMMIAHDKNIDELALKLYSMDTARRRLPRVSFSGFPALRADLPRARVQGRLSVISGADDQVIGHGAEAEGRELLALRPDAHYHALEGAGHWVMYEAAERYNEALLRALEA